ncbi:hypothetical protein ACFTZB_35090 [Rhodococcus sp. NPDC057014]|uniref:hypothetical protein n=1 Tax=Rhodococcus sp. NPDC057014 TaxID=3346000 RepID=UPI0036330B1E
MSGIGAAAAETAPLDHYYRTPQKMGAGTIRTTGTRTTTTAASTPRHPQADRQHCDHTTPEQVGSL